MSGGQQCEEPSFKGQLPEGELSRDNFCWGQLYSRAIVRGGGNNPGCRTIAPEENCPWMTALRIITPWQLPLRIDHGELSEWQFSLGWLSLGAVRSVKWSDPGHFLKSQGNFFCHFHVPFFTYFWLLKLRMRP